MYRGFSAGTHMIVLAGTAGKQTMRAEGAGASLPDGRAARAQARRAPRDGPRAAADGPAPAAPPWSLQAASVQADSSAVFAARHSQVSVHAQPAHERPTPNPIISVRLPGRNRPEMRRSRIRIGMVEETVLP